MSKSLNHAVCWAEIPVTDLEKGRKFYSSVLDVQLETVEFGGGNIVFFPMTEQEEVSGHIYQGKPAPAGTGPTVHLRIDKLEDATKRAINSGAEKIGDPVTIPSGRFQYIQDPDGNSVGLFEMAS